MAAVHIGEYLTIDPEIMHGRLTFRGTRVPVSTVLAYIAEGLSIDEVGQHWPQIRREAVQEALLLASEALHRQYAAECAAAECEAERLRDESCDAAAVS